jgi:hypothetical protein
LSPKPSQLSENGLLFLAPATATALAAAPATLLKGLLLRGAGLGLFEQEGFFLGGQGFFFGHDIDLGGVQCGSLLGRRTGEGEGEQVLSLIGEQLTGEGLLVHDLTGVHSFLAGGLLNMGLRLELQLFTMCLDLSLHVLCLLGGEWQLIGLQETGLLWSLLMFESRLLGELLQ